MTFYANISDIYGMFAPVYLAKQLSVLFLPIL